MVGNILCFIVSTGYPYKGTSLGSNSTGFLAISHLGATVRKRFPKEHRLVKRLSEGNEQLCYILQMLSTGKQSFQSFQLEIHTYLFYNNFKKKKREKEKFYLLTKK